MHERKKIHILFFQNIYSTPLEKHLIMGKSSVYFIILCYFLNLHLLLSKKQINDKNFDSSFLMNFFGFIFSMKIQILNSVFRNIEIFYIAIIFQIFINLFIFFSIFTKIFSKIQENHEKIISILIQIYNYIFFIPFLDFSFLILFHKSNSVFQYSFENILEIHKLKIVLFYLAIFNVILTVAFGLIFSFFVYNQDLCEKENCFSLVEKFSRKNIFARIAELIILIFYNNSNEKEFDGF